MRKWLPYALFLLMIPAVAHADSMTWSFTAIDKDMHFVIPGKDVRTQLGIFTINITDTAPPTDWPYDGSFLAFCVDVQHYVHDSYDVVLDDMAEWQQPYDDPPDFPTYSGAGSYVAYLINYYGMPSNLVDQSAMQLAVWEILYEDSGPFNVTNGAAYAYGVENSSIIAQANFYLTPINDLWPVIPDAHAPWIKTLHDDSRYYQDFTTPVPEPSTLILLGAGLLIAAASTRKKLR
jgi:hypothetical protein